MIESATAHAPAAPNQDAGYASWQTAARKAVMRHDLNDRTAGPMPSFGSMVYKTALAAQDMRYAPAHASNVSAADGRPDLAYDGEKEEFSFGDVIDIINPLQHLPVIGTLYRKFTGDTMNSFSSIIGGAIFGGPIGAVTSTANAIVKDRTGKDIAENAFSAVGIDATPAQASKPNIVIESPIQYASFAKADESLAAATLYSKTADGHKNFAAKAATYSWNT